MIGVLTLWLLLQAPASQASGGSVTGIVTDATTKAPVAFAHLLLTPVDRPLAQSIVGKADVQGAFRIANVPAGTYRVFAEDRDYLRQESSAPIVVPAGQSAAGVTIAMTRTGVIAGRVLTEHGDPAPTIYVRAWQGSKLVAETRTNDLGEYRLFGLAPGSFVVGAERYRGPTIGRTAPSGMGPGAAQALGGQDRYWVPTPPCPDCRGEGVGAGAVSLYLKTGAYLDPRALTGRTYPTVFFDATTDRAQARTIDVAAGAEISGIDLRLIAR